MEPSPAQLAARDRITAQLAQAGFALPGTLTVRAYACGKPGCRCHADPPRLHGPYAEWTRKIGGKTITRRLTPAELAEYQPLFDNAKKLRTLLSELQDLTLQIIETGATREPSTPAEPEPAAPENVGEARLTCGQHPSRSPSNQVSPKREDHTFFECFIWRVAVQVRGPCKTAQTMKRNRLTSRRGFSWGGLRAWANLVSARSARRLARASSATLGSGRSLRSLGGKPTRPQRCELGATRRCGSRGGSLVEATPPCRRHAALSMVWRGWITRFG
jgi:hypothetical protein